MKNNILLTLAALAIVALSHNSCKKPEVDTETQSATDNAICEAEFTAIVPSTNSKAIAKKGISGVKLTGVGPLIEVIDSVDIGGKPKWPRRLRIDYDRDATGSPVVAGYLDADGRIRKGIISMVVDKPWVDSVKSKIFIDSLHNYMVNGTQYKATSITINKNANSYSTVVDNGECFNSSWWLHWSGTRTFTYINGTNDVEVTGSATGSNRDGVSYTTNIRSAIVKKESCAYITSGIIDITPNGKATRTIDYSVDAAGKSTGACDNAVALTIKGNTFIFKMD